MATIVNRGPYQFQATIRRKGFPTQTKTLESRKDAETWATIIESEMVRGTFVPRAEAERTTLAAALERYRDEVTTTKKGRAQEERRIDAWLLDPLAKRSLASLTSTDFAKFRDDRIKTASASTVIKDLALISHLFTIAIKEWRLPLQNPIQNIRKPKLPPGRNRRLLAEEEIYLLRACRESKAPALETVVRLALETAMRRGEILKMQWQHVDLNKQTAFLPDTKNGDSRTVPLSSRAVHALRKWPRSFDARVFPQYSHTDSFKKAWGHALIGAKKIYIGDCNKQGVVPDPMFLADLRFHDLRHEATSRLAEKLPNVLELAAVTGHKDLRMLKRYYHPKAEDLARKLG